MTAIVTAEQCQQHPTETGEMHLALFYCGEQEYVDGVMRFIEPALRSGEPVAIAVPGRRAALLRETLGTGAGVELLDMVELGHNPARIIPAVEGILARHQGQLLHYVGEPIWPGRSQEEIREATKHEALINLAWPGAHIRVLCLYDAEELDPYVLVDAERTHPHLIRGCETVPSPGYEGLDLPLGCEEPLSEPPPDALTLPFGLPNLYAVRSMVKWISGEAGLGEQRTDDLVLGINELATNTIRHTHGGGLLRVWRLPGEVICQVEDSGHIHDPLAGRRTPALGAEGGVGLWSVNQLCDLVEVRSGGDGTMIRVHAAVG